MTVTRSSGKAPIYADKAQAPQTRKRKRGGEGEKDPTEPKRRKNGAKEQAAKEEGVAKQREVQDPSLNEEDLSDVDTKMVKLVKKVLQGGDVGSIEGITNWLKQDKWEEVFDKYLDKEDLKKTVLELGSDYFSTKYPAVHSYLERAQKTQETELSDEPRPDSLCDDITKYPWFSSISEYRQEIQSSPRYNKLTVQIADAMMVKMTGRSENQDLLLQYKSSVELAGYLTQKEYVREGDLDDRQRKDFEKFLMAGWTDGS